MLEVSYVVERVLTRLVPTVINVSGFCCKPTRHSRTKMVRIFFQPIIAAVSNELRIGE